MRDFMMTALCISAAMAVSVAPAFGQVQREPGGTTIMGPVETVPNGGRPVQKVSFPDIKDWSSLHITLTRGMCLGRCPAYSVEIDGDGTVTYQGDDYVLVKGKQLAHISAQAVRDLFELFRAADYFSSLDSYTAPVTDFPSFSTSIEFDGHKKSVTDYVGRAVGMPKELIALEDAIDKTAGTDRWIGESDTP